MHLRLVPLGDPHRKVIRDATSALKPAPTGGPSIPGNHQTRGRTAGRLFHHQLDRHEIDGRVLVPDLRGVPSGRVRGAPGKRSLHQARPGCKRRRGGLGTVHDVSAHFQPMRALMQMNVPLHQGMTDITEVTEDAVHPPCPAPIPRTAGPTPRRAEGVPQKALSRRTRAILGRWAEYDNFQG